MKKLKLFIFTLLSVLTLGLFVVTGSKVEAATTTLYDAATDTVSKSYAVPTGDSVNAINEIDTDILILQTIGMAATVENKSNVKYLWFGTNSTDGTKGFKVTNLSSTNSYSITLSLYATDSSKNAKAGETINFNGATAVSSSSDVADVTSILAPNTSAMLYVSTNNRRMLLKKVEYEIVSTYTVSFVKNGANEIINSQTVASGSKLSNTGTITKTGYIFDGWYTKDGTGNVWGEKWDFETDTVTSDMSLYAKWVQGTLYTITFMNGTDTYATKNVVDGENNNKVAEWPTSPTKVGYTFVGWFNQEVEYDENSSFNSDVVLNAVYSQNVIGVGESLSLDINGISNILNGNSVQQCNVGKFIVNEKTGKNEGLKMSNSYLCFNNKDSGTYIAFSIPANTIAKITIVGCKAGAELTFELGSTSKNISFADDAKLDTFTVTICNTTNSVGTIHIYRSNGIGALIKSLNVSVNENSGLLSDMSTLNVDAETNTNKSVLRFITTISGVELENVDKIELMIKKDSGDYKTVELTSVYESISGASSLYSANTANNTYYGLFKLNNAQAIAGSTITFTAVVTYTDDSSVTMDAKSFVMPSAS